MVVGALVTSDQDFHLSERLLLFHVKLVRFSSTHRLVAVVKPTWSPEFSLKKKKKSAYLLVKWGSPLALFSFWSPLSFPILFLCNCTQWYFTSYCKEFFPLCIFLTCCRPIYLAQWCWRQQAYYNVSSVFCASPTFIFCLSSYHIDLQS